MPVQVPMTEPTTLLQLLPDPDAGTPAVITTAPPRVMTHRALSRQVDQLSGRLRRTALRPGDCVAVALPNGLEFIVVLLALAQAGLVAAPMNPGYKAGELRPLFDDMQPVAVIAGRDNAAAIAAAAGHGIALWACSADADGSVDLSGLPRSPVSYAADPRTDDVALFLHTSGSTGRPKTVPLTHANVLSSVSH